MRGFGLALLLIALSFSGCGKKEDALSGAESPVDFGTMAQNELNLAELMASHSEAIVSPQPWASYWYPYGSGGISSAARKYDTAYIEFLRSQGVDTSNYDGAASWEYRRHGPGYPLLESWFGHCNGWSAAAIMTPEPREGKTINGVNFDVGDLKALVSESWMEFSGDFVGTRVQEKGDLSSAAYWDIAPAHFVLILTNVVGRAGRGVIFDRHTGYEVWNQPLVAYRLDKIKTEDYLGAHPSAPDVYRVNMRAQMWWAEDNIARNAITPPFDINDPNYRFFKTRKLAYELWLDGPVEFDGNGNMVSSGNILITQENGRYVGGFWKNGFSGEGSKNAHPDYMWLPFAIQGSSGYKNQRLDDKWIGENISARYR